MCYGERGKECETENKKIEEKNRMCKCVGERQRHRPRESSCIWSFHVLSTWLRPTVVTLSANWDNLIKGYQMCSPCAASISWDCSSRAEWDSSSITHDNQVRLKESLSKSVRVCLFLYMRGVGKCWIYRIHVNHKLCWRLLIACIYCMFLFFSEIIMYNNTKEGFGSWFLLLYFHVLIVCNCYMLYGGNVCFCLICCFLSWPGHSFQLGLFLVK